MSAPLPIIHLARYVQTEWSTTGQHTGLTELPLADHGERNARKLGDRLIQSWNNEHGGVMPGC